MTQQTSTSARSTSRRWNLAGSPLDGPATAGDAIREAGLDWSVALEAVRDLRGKDIPGARALVRTDQMTALSVVGTGYRPIQNAEAFRFADLLVGEHSEGAEYTSAGSLDGGRRIWLEMKLPGDVWVAGEDRVEKYLLLSNPHFRGSSLWVLLTARRLACENRLLATLSEGRSHAVRIRHVGDVDGRVAEAQRLLGLSLKYYDAFGEQARHFASRALREETVKEYFKTVLPDPEGADPSRIQATRETMLRLFETGHGSDLPGVRGTLWGAVNAVSEWVDHERPTRKAGVESALSRWKSATFGNGAVLKEHAWRLALAYAS